ncbi:hypothetical protein ASF06_01770 [Agreia sp. Leaf244]|nr:hypothetical protein ASF06_01770 [Agreia sp. Leaf244]
MSTWLPDGIEPRYFDADRLPSFRGGRVELVSQRELVVTFGVRLAHITDLDIACIDGDLQPLTLC